MLKSNELKRKIDAKRQELENYQAANNLSAATRAAKELNALVDEYNLETARERTEDENFFRHFNPENGSFITGAGVHNKSKNKIGVQGDEYKKHFFDAFRNKFSNEATLKLLEGTLPQGGYLVPSQFADAIQSALEEENPIRKIATVIQTESEYLMPYVATKPAATWISEGQTINLTAETFDRMTLGAYKLGAAITMSNELLADSYYDLESHLTLEFSKAIARAEEEAFITGAPDENTGAVTRPTGILTTISTDTDYYKETATIGEISADDLINLQYSVRRPYRRNACFLTSDETLAQIRKLKDETGRFIWQPSMQEGEPPQIFGQPVYTSPYMPSPESGKIAVIYGDFRYYIVAERGQRTCRALRELFALQDISAFLILERIDGKLTDKEAIRGLKVK